MVVLASSICTKSGKAVVSRQYVEMSRSRIEGLLASFPKLISNGHQHTYIETDSVRYIYQPLEDLYMVLITNKQSNILQDNETLHLFARAVSEYCRSLKESEVAENAFELLMAFDEIISPFGYRENVTLQQVKTNTEMESHEEKLQEMAQKTKEREAIENAKLKAKQLDMQKREAKRGGMPSSSRYGSSTTSFSSLRSPPLPTTVTETKQSMLAASLPVTASTGSRGLQLGGGKPKTSDLLEAVKVEEGIRELDLNSTSSTSTPVSSVPVPQKSTPQEGIVVTFDEKISAEVNRDGGLNNLEVKGDMYLQISDTSKAKAQFKLDIKGDLGSSVQFKTNPHVDKNNWANSKVISTKDKSTAFPINQSIPVLKWRFTTKDESLAPFSINFWPSVSGNNRIDCSVEYELLSESFSLQNVKLSIPLGNQQPPTPPKVNHVDGEYLLNQSTKCLEWLIPIMDSSSPSGTFEFSIPGDNDNILFPVVVTFSSNKTYIGLEVVEVNEVDSNNNNTIPFIQVAQVVSEDYKII